MAEVQISISLFIGFGWCAESVPHPEPDGSSSFTYRYLPAGLWHPDTDYIRALVNAAANVFPTFDLFPPDLLPTNPLGGDKELTPAGTAFYESCPMYARLDAINPWLTWHQHHPKGGVSWSARANNYEALIEQVLREWPISEWAEKFLEPWRDLLGIHPKHGPRAMYMQSALQEDGGREIQEDGWTKGDIGNARADVHERVESPWGLYKVLLVSCSEDRVEGCKKMQFNEQFQLIPCSLAFRKGEGEPFVWREHHVWRIEQPVQFLPRSLKWTADEDVAHPGAWGAKGIYPCYAWDMPEFRYQLNPEEAGWDLMGLVYKPLAEMDLVELAQYEHDFVNLPRPPLQ